MNINTKMCVNHIRSTWVKDSFRSVTVRFESRQPSLATIDPLVPAWTRLWRGIEWHRPELRESIVEHWLRDPLQLNFKLKWGNNEVAVGICWNYIYRINPNYKISDVLWFPEMLAFACICTFSIWRQGCCVCHLCKGLLHLFRRVGREWRLPEGGILWQHQWTSSNGETSKYEWHVFFWIDHQIWQHHVTIVYHDNRVTTGFKYFVLFGKPSILLKDLFLLQMPGHCSTQVAERQFAQEHDLEPQSFIGRKLSFFQSSGFNGVNGSVRAMTCFQI